MSNPAVITLDSINSRRGKIKRFQLEDNIGESIHLHVDNMRIDFSIKEFLDFANMVRLSLNGLDLLPGYTIDDFDECFLKECADMLPFLREIKIEEVRLGDLKCIVRSSYKGSLTLLKLRKIGDIPAFQYLSGNNDKFRDYVQYNYFNMDNVNRITDSLNSIEKKGYPLNNKYIILFDGQNIVRDGQHRAAILAHIHGLNSTIKVMRFYFNKNFHHIHVHKRNVQVVIRWLVKTTYRKLKLNLRKVSLR